MKKVNASSTVNKEFLMKAVKFIVLIFLVSSAQIFSQLGAEVNKTGTTSAQFLKIGVGSRPIGMGGAFTSLADDINSIYWNPAGLARMYSREAGFNHVDWIADVSLDYAGFGMDLEGFGTVGAFVSVMAMDEMIVRSLEKPEGTGELFDAGSVVLGLSYARNLTEEFSIGFNGKYIREYIWNESASAFAVDIGTIYAIPFLNQFRIGASISNFGTKMKLEGRDILKLTTVGSGEGNIINSDIQLDAFELPLMFRFGVSVDAVKSNENRVTLAVDAVHPNDNSEYLNTGLEYTWQEIVFIRGGYKNLFEKDGEQGLTLGFGINYRIIEAFRIKLDYAYQEFGRLKNVQYFSLGVRF